ncbi:MAG: SDR family oxidoreductase [Anaerolineales bacterium]|jgi:NAD(P)-dependent dehydrogenase (short-subunit alcohol dehydrogenase family)|nr:SDR family oxidoreductase [Anaerolineales bacterium]
MDLKELTKLYDFSDRTAVITGGAGIIGGEMACALVGCCANVAILDRAPELADRLIERFEGGPGKAIVVYADVLKPDTMHKAEQVIQTEFNSSVHMLINAAGGNNSKATTSDDLPFFDLPEEALRFVFDLNLLGTFLSSQVFGRGMAELGEGVIVNISSMAALRPLTRIPAYSAAKSGVGNFTRWLAVHMAQEHSPRIRVNAIAPGFFLTEQNRFLLTDADSGELTDRGRTILKHTPMDRFGDPEDLLGTLLWLLSPASAFVTGVVVPVDGGFSAFSGV